MEINQRQIGFVLCRALLNSHVVRKPGGGGHMRYAQEHVCGCEGNVCGERVVWVKVGKEKKAEKKGGSKLVGYASAYERLGQVVVCGWVGGPHAGRAL